MAKKNIVVENSYKTNNETEKRELIRRHLINRLLSMQEKELNPTLVSV